MEKSINLNKTIAIVAKNEQANLKKLKTLIRILESFSYKISLDKNSAEMLALKEQGKTLEELAKDNELFISFGGDGTLISVARRLAYEEVHIIGVYAGNLGFLTDINFENLEEFLRDFEQGKYLRMQPRFLQASMEFKDGTFKEVLAFNDICILRDSTLSMAKIEAYLGTRHFNTYFGDGLIISSSIGSTAYNMSAGGPIIHPMSEILCLTPICSHSLTQRSLLLPDSFELGFKTKNKNVVLLIDGHENYKMDDIAKVKISLSQVRANLIKQRKIDYFDVLKEKLHWGN